MTLTGKILIVLAFLISVITFYWAIFMIPVFLLGLVLVVSGKKIKILSKILWSVLPIFLWYPTLIGFMFVFGVIGKAKAQKIDFIIKEGVVESITLIDNMPCGQAITIENGREQIVLTKGFINMYRGNLEYGYLNHDYYYITENGKKIEGTRNRFDIEFLIEVDSGRVKKIILKPRGMSKIQISSDMVYHKQIFYIIDSTQTFEPRNGIGSFKKRDSINKIIEDCYTN